MNARSFREKLNIPAIRELLIIGLVAVFIIIVSITTGWTENMIKSVYRVQNTILDDILIFFTVIGFLLTIYTVRRYNEKTELIRSIERTKNNLRSTNDHLQVLMQSTSAIVFNVKATADFDLIYMSENVTQILGYSKDEVLEKKFWSNNLHPEDAPAVFAEMPVLFKTGSLSLQYRFKHKNGSWRWMQAEVKCLFDDKGNPDNVVGNWWDITENKKRDEITRTASERLELSFKATRNVMYDWNLLTQELWLSDEIYRSYGYNKETVRADLYWWEHKIHPADHGSIMSSVTNALAKKEDSWSGEYRFQLADGTYADIFDNGYISYNADGLPLRWIGSMSDVTTLKKTEAELKIALIKSEESAKAKSEFLANMSHEIRTPLNGIVGMADLALDSELNAQQKRYLETIKFSCDSLMSLINDILDFSKIEAGKLDLSPVNFSLRDEVPGLLSPLALKASYKKLELVFSLENDVPDFVFGDVYRLQQIITNLVGNAIKFTEKGDVALKVKLQSSNEDEMMLLFSVTDTGIGIPAHKLDAVFEGFTQADGSTTRKYGGTGLGLSITKHLVELMGGSIWVESQEAKGSTFYFTIKMQLQKQAEKQRFLPLPVLDNSPILIIEDNDLSRECIIRILENFGMKPIGVDNGEKAIDELKRAANAGNPYPLVLTDITLAGEMDGFDVTECIKQDNDLSDTDIIVISMSQRVSDRERFALLGVSQYFAKPYSQSDLLDSIQNSLSARNKAVPHDPPEHAVKEPLITNTNDTYKILLAEDNLVNQEVAASMLNKKGHTVVIANNGAEAAALYREEAFDLVLMDVQMPMLNGYEATARIRDIENVTGKYTPIIGLTANAMKGDREKCLDAGMDDYVSKPVRLNDLFSALDRVKQKIRRENTTEEFNTHKNSVVSLDTLIENFEGDYEIVESILEKFDSTVLTQMNAIESNAKKGNFPEILAMSHTLKGQCMLVEMEEVVKLAGQIEILAQKNALTEINQLIPILKTELKKGLKALEEAWAELAKKEMA